VGVIAGAGVSAEAAGGAAADSFLGAGAGVVGSLGIRSLD
jgi:hypothetical protein